MINSNTYKYPSQYGSVYGTGTQTPPPLVSPTGFTNSALGLPQTQARFSYQNPQFDTTAATTPDLSTIVQTIIAIVTQLIQTLSGSGTNAQNDQTDTDDNATPTPTPTPGAGQGGGGGCHDKGGKGKPESNETPTPAPVPAPAPSSADKSSGDPNATQEQQEFLALVNKARADAGLKPVKLNNKLNQSAMDYSGTQAKLGKISHEADGTNFGQRNEKFSYTSNRGENVAMGQQSVQDVFKSWMDSPGHRDNILMSDATEIGLGHVGAYWTQEIGNG